MCVRDPVRHLQGQRERIRPADQQMAGVQAQLDARALQNPVHIAAGLDHGSDVRMQHGEHTAVVRGIGEPVEIGQQRGPLRCRRASAASRIHLRLSRPPARVHQPRMRSARRADPRCRPAGRDRRREVPLARRCRRSAGRSSRASRSTRRDRTARSRRDPVRWRTTRLPASRRALDRRRVDAPSRAPRTLPMRSVRLRSSGDSL